MPARVNGSERDCCPRGLGGELQHAAIGSEMATRVYDATFAKLSRGQAAATIREAMMDPDAFRALAKNWNNVDDAATASNVVMRLLTRVPATGSAREFRRSHRSRRQDQDWTEHTDDEDAATNVGYVGYVG